MSDWKQVLGDLASSRATPLKRFAFLLCGDPAEAEDLVQDALVRAFSRPLRSPSAGEAEAFVRVIIANRFIDLARRRAAFGRAVIRLAPTASAVPDPADGVALRADLAAALATLTPRQRACVVLHYYEDLTIAQIARALGCGEGTVKRTLHDARFALHIHVAPIERGITGGGEPTHADL
jgi:RNA polymerase sigma-70 factor (sigma-E family)